MKSSYVLLLVCLLGACLISCDQGSPATDNGNSATHVDNTKSAPKTVPVDLLITGYEQKQVVPDRIVVKSATGEVEYISSRLGDLKQKGLLPGAYQATISKKGYRDCKVKFEVSKKKHTLSARMETKPRNVTFAKNVAWDSIEVDGEDWSEAKGELSPGRHSVVAKKYAYRTFKANINIPVGEGELAPISIELLPELRKFLVTVRDSENSGKKLQYELLLTQGEKVIPIKSGEKIEPGKYVLKIACPGYRKFEKNIEIAPGTTPYSEDVVLQAIAICLNLKLMANGRQVEADRIFLNDKLVKNGDSIAPGSYMLKVEKKGFHTVNEPVMVKGSGDFTHIIAIKSLLRPITLLFQDSSTGKTLFPDVWLDEKRYGTNMSLAPGKYALKATLDGYRSIDLELVLPAGKDRYTREFKMEAVSTGSEFSLQFDVGAMVDSSQLVPKVATLDDREIKPGEIFSYGKHHLVLEVPGYKPIDKEIVIPKGQMQHVELVKLEAFAIRLELNIFLDYPSGIGQPDKILIDGKAFTGEITPGAHQIEVIKAGYESLHEYILIQQGETVHQVTRFMKALLRKVDLKFIDAATGQSIEPQDVKFDEDSVPFQNIFEKKPGNYQLEVFATGYKQYSQAFKIDPGEDTITETISLEKE